jgi:acyl carrier protein
MAMADIDWSRLKPLYERLRPRPLMAAFDLVPKARAPRAPAPTDSAPNEANSAANGARDAALPLSDFLIGEIARVLGFERGALDQEAQLADLGFDSMMAIQLRGAVTRERGLELPLRTLLQGLSTRALVELVSREIEDVESASAAPADMGLGDESSFEVGML